VTTQAKVKGAAIVFTRDCLEKLSQEQQKAFFSVLPRESVLAFKAIMPIHWMPLLMAAQIMEAAAPILYPSAANPLYQLGHAMARNTLTGIYKILLRITTVSYVLGQGTKIWRTLNNKGRIWVERAEDKNQAVFCVADYPELPDNFRKVITGYIAGGWELTGSKNILVTEHFENSSQWRWEFTWE
jgi:hypothetical protein